MKKIAYAAAALVIGAVLYVGVNWRPCSGWRDCYFSWRLFWSGSTAADGLRQPAITQFAASSRWIAFPVPLDSQSTGLLVINRDSGRRHLIAEDGRSFSSPHLSSDNERLVLIGRSDRTGQRELLSCTTAAWECDVFLRTDNRVISPVELDKETLIYSMSPGRIGGDNRLRYAYHDFYLQKKGSEPIRLTHFEFYQLDSINLARGKLIFHTFGPGLNKGVFPGIPDVLAPAKSEIYALDFDEAERRIKMPAQMLKPMFLMDGLSWSAAVSRDGTLGKGPYRYNMAVATIDGEVLNYIKVEGIAFSPGVFVHNTLLFNELFADHYKVKRFDLSRGTIEDIDTVEHAPARLKALERINLNRRSGAV